MQSRKIILDQLITKKLFLLLPFLFFNHEKELKRTSHDPARYHHIRVMYETILNKLKVLEESEVITAYEAITLYDALKLVFVALGKKNNAEQEVEAIMGGEILEFEADKYFDAGKAEGREEGRAEGREEGRAEGREEGKAEGKAEGKTEGEERLANLVRTLIINGRSEEVARAASDKQFRR